MYDYIYNERFEQLKACLFKAGHEALCDFVDHDIPEDEPKTVTEMRLNDTYMQIDERILNIYYEHYGI